MDFVHYFSPVDWVGGKGRVRMLASGTCKWLARAPHQYPARGAAFEGQKGGSDAPSLFLPSGKTRV